MLLHLFNCRLYSALALFTRERVDAARPPDHRRIVERWPPFQTREARPHTFASLRKSGRDWKWASQSSIQLDYLAQLPYCLIVAARVVKKPAAPVPMMGDSGSSSCARRISFSPRRGDPRAQVYRVPVWPSHNSGSCDGLPVLFSASAQFQSYSLTAAKRRVRFGQRVVISIASSPPPSPAGGPARLEARHTRLIGCSNRKAPRTSAYSGSFFYRLIKDIDAFLVALFRSLVQL